MPFKCKIILMSAEDSIKTEIKLLATKRGWTQERLAEELGLRLNKKYTGNNLTKKLRTETIPYREVRLIADILGYDIEFVDRNKKQG